MIGVRPGAVLPARRLPLDCQRLRRRDRRGGSSGPTPTASSWSAGWRPAFRSVRPMRACGRRPRPSTDAPAGRVPRRTSDPGALAALRHQHVADGRTRRRGARRGDARADRRGAAHRVSQPGGDAAGARPRPAQGAGDPAGARRQPGAHRASAAHRGAVAVAAGGALGAGLAALAVAGPASAPSPRGCRWSSSSTACDRRWSAPRRCCSACSPPRGSRWVRRCGTRAAMCWPISKPQAGDDPRRPRRRFLPRHPLAGGASRPVAGAAHRRRSLRAHGAVGDGRRPRASTPIGPCWPKSTRRWPATTRRARAPSSAAVERRSAGAAGRALRGARRARADGHDQHRQVGGARRHRRAGRRVAGDRRRRAAPSRCPGTR